MSQVSLVAVMLVCVVAGCDRSEPLAPRAATGDGKTAPAAETAAHSTAPFTIDTRPSDALRLATVTLHNSPYSQATPGAVSVLADTIRQFDIVAVQRPRGDVEGLRPLLEQINRGDANFQIALDTDDTNDTDAAGSDRLVFIFDADRVLIDRESIHSVSDPGRRLKRDPLVARFAARQPSRESTFTFLLVHVWADEQNAVGELPALFDLWESLTENPYGEDDTILLGNFGVQPDRLNDFADDRGDFTPIARRHPIGHATGNFVFNIGRTSEFRGRAGVFDLQAAYGLSASQARQVVDPFPVWAEFRHLESGEATMAARTVASEEIRQ